MIPNAWSDTLLAQLCAFPHCHHFPGAEPSASLCFPTQEAAESSEASPPPALTTQCPQPPLTGHAFSTVTCFVALLLMPSRTLTSLLSSTPQVPFFCTVFQQLCPNPVALHEIVVIKMQDPALSHSPQPSNSTSPKPSVGLSYTQAD